MAQQVRTEVPANGGLGAAPRATTRWTQTIVLPPRRILAPMMVEWRGPTPSPSSCAGQAGLPVERAGARALRPEKKTRPVTVAVVAGGAAVRARAWTCPGRTHRPPELPAVSELKVDAMHHGNLTMVLPPRAQPGARRCRTTEFGMPCGVVDESERPIWCWGRTSSTVLDVSPTGRNGHHGVRPCAKHDVGRSRGRPQQLDMTATSLTVRHPRASQFGKFHRPGRWQQRVWEGAERLLG